MRTSTYRKTKRGLPFGGVTHVRKGGGTLGRVFFMLSMFRFFSALLVYDMGGCERLKDPGGFRSFRTLNEPQPIGKNLTPHGIEGPRGWFGHVHYRPKEMHALLDH